MRPLIGMTTWVAPYDEQRLNPTPYVFEFLHRAYAIMFRAAGAVPILLPNSDDPEEVRRIIGVLDGLLLSGGEDWEPHHFGENAQTKTLELAPDRDTFELLAVKEADRIGLPILGICRGIQSLNVAYGGSLYQDLVEQRPKPTNNHSRCGAFYRRYHDVTIHKGTRLYEIIGKERINVSTAHHQAIKDLGKELQPNSVSVGDDVIEGVEVPGTRFVLAVQWHPEVMPEKDDNTRRLAAAFVQALKT